MTTRVRPAEIHVEVQAFLAGHHETAAKINRALDLLGPERAGTRTAQELLTNLMVIAARRHEAGWEAGLHAVDPALARLAGDLDSLAPGGPPARDPGLRAEDLRIVAEAQDEFRDFRSTIELLVGDGELRHNAVQELRARRAAAAANPDAPLEVELPHVPTGPTLQSVHARAETVLAEVQAILKAYDEGRTHEPYLPKPRTIRRDDRVLVRQMDALRREQRTFLAAIDAAGDDPIAVDAALERLRLVQSHSGEVLRESAIHVDDVSRPTDPVPPDQLPRGPVEPGSPAARRLDAENRLRALVATNPDLGSLAAAPLFEALHFSDVEAWVSSAIGEPLRRSGTETKYLSVADIRGLRTDPPWLADMLAHHLAGYERAHLSGPGFGVDVVAGLMLAPEGVNQIVQNNGVELYVREAARVAPGSTEVFATVHGRRLLIPLEGGKVETIDVVSSVHYEIHRQLDGKPLPLLEVRIEVQPNGHWTVPVMELPAGAPGADMPRSGNR